MKKVLIAVFIVSGLLLSSVCFAGLAPAKTTRVVKQTALTVSPDNQRICFPNSSNYDEVVISRDEWNSVGFLPQAQETPIANSEAVIFKVQTKDCAYHVPVGTIADAAAILSVMTQQKAFIVLKIPDGKDLNCKSLSVDAAGDFPGLICEADIITVAMHK